ncbi:hypothetical protein BKA93DRAFT_832101 [Sparassis latifolia]
MAASCQGFDCSDLLWPSGDHDTRDPALRWGKGVIGASCGAQSGLAVTLPKFCGISDQASSFQFEVEFVRERQPAQLEFGNRDRKHTSRRPTRTDKGQMAFTTELSSPELPHRLQSSGDIYGNVRPGGSDPICVPQSTNDHHGMPGETSARNVVEHRQRLRVREYEELANAEIQYLYTLPVPAGRPKGLGLLERATLLNARVIG